MLGCWLLLAFTLVPLGELYLLLRVGEWLGAGPTLLLVLVTGAAGAALARAQGLKVLREIQDALSAGRLPHRELLEGALVFAGGLMLLTPGVVTDAAGLLVMIPPVRRAAAALLAAWLRRRLVVHTVVGFDGGRAPGEVPPDPRGPGATPARGRTVEVEFRPEEEGPEEPT
ncbi:MAG: FxsA family protein [Deltaproteobacteria bacterium]|nr:MAG: FxsA family protein [Deltaproteobacteria bacterium]